VFKKSGVTVSSVHPRVLIVDDEERVADTYKLRLGEGYEVEIALSGKEALETIDEEFDVVLLDRRMSEMSGDEVLEEIRKRGLDCRVVMVTAVDPDFDITEMDLDDYVVKPVEKEQLQDVVDHAVKISEYNEQMQELSALKLKRNVLEVELPSHELDESPKYQTLVESIENQEEAIRELEDDLDLDQVDLYL
jgi:DNA-binding response OmpR family regulator